MNLSERFDTGDKILIENEKGSKFLVLIEVDNGDLFLGRFQYTNLTDQWSEDSYGGLFIKENYKLIERL